MFGPQQGSMDPTTDCYGGIVVPNCSSFPVQWEYYQSSDCRRGIALPNCSSFRVQGGYYRSADCCRGIALPNCSSFQFQWEYYWSADCCRGIDISRIRYRNELHAKKNSDRWLTTSFHALSNSRHLWQSRELQEQGVFSK